jgi:hypothetical protein
MCVIMIANKTRPTEEMVKRAWDTNSHGAGIAWREGKGANTEVVWEKGIMELERIQELVAKVPRPFVVHFRIASVGGTKASLTHPFVVSLEAPLPLKGRTKGQLLFHNGHWSEWQGKALDAAIHSNNTLPEGSDWSDTRAMAYMVAIYGKSVMELLPRQKGVVMDPEKFSIFTGDGWEKINDVWCSNDYFWSGRGRHNNTPYSGQQQHGRLCETRTCHERVYVAGETFCWKCREEKKKNVAEISGNSASVGQSREVSETQSPLVRTFSVQEVETYYKAGVVSKSTLKKYRKASSGAAEKGNRGLRAQKELRELTVKISEALQSLETLDGSIN